MAENYTEETLENPEEEETSEKETSVEEQETSLEKPESSPADTELSPEELKAQRDRLYARLKKEEERRKELEKRIKKSTPLEAEDEWKAKVEFLLQHRDYTEEEFDHIATIAARKGISLTEAAKEADDYIKFRREKVAQEKKIPASNSPEFGSQLVDEKKITRSTPPEEAEKILKARIEKLKEKSKSGI